MLQKLTRRLSFLVVAGILSVPGAHAQGVEKASIKLAMAAPSPAFLPLYLADSEGFFKAEGLSVGMVTFRSGSDAVRGLVSGAIDINAGSLNEVLHAIEAGQPFRVFYSGMNSSLTDWYAVPQVNSIKDTAGKRYGVTNYGSMIDFLTRYALMANKINPKDVKIIPAGKSSARVAAMEAGQLDVNALIPPAKYVAADRGFKKIFSQRDLAPDYPLEVFAASEKTLDKAPKTVKAFLRAYAKGVEFAKKNRDKAIAELEKRLGVKGKYASMSYDEVIKDIHADGRLPSKAGMKVYWDLEAMSGEAKKPLAESRWLDRRYMDSYAKWSKM